MLGIKKFFPYIAGLTSSSPRRKPQPHSFQPTPTAHQPNQLRPVQGEANQRGRFISRFFNQSQRIELDLAREISKASPKVADEMRRLAASGELAPEEAKELRLALERSLAASTNRAAPRMQTMNRHEESDLQRAIKLSLESHEAEKLQRRELELVLEISKSSPKVADEMRRLAASGELAPEDAKELRLALEKSLAPSIISAACAKAFRVISKGFRDYQNESRVSSPVSTITDKSAERISLGINYSPMDVLLSAMAEGNNRFRDWAKSKDLQIVANTAHENNCALLSLMQHASGDYNADFREMAQRIKEELVEKFPDEVEGKNAMLDASIDSRSFQYALRKINEMFHVDMDVHVIQAGNSGLPALVEPRDPAPGKTPVVLWNSGAHFEAVVHKSAISGRS